ncbi:hypothetical protein A3SI_02768 [Nitritalea halalkaliphila LW7]|uniref:Uncharacterized protein n=1 Tax=Nitritalea halalkaliphila LW7 TaxID=1189621 RepID=I5C9E8_9BACT|nr:hypothetical protein [Nitritalea halalkaliphila]EIM78450.1 hypothetical protein A3SI_02768 [Nitritalea halalkaliphila LW7]
MNTNASMVFKKYFLFLQSFTILHLTDKINKAMAVTTLKRKLKRRRQAATTRVARIKQLTAKPVIKNVDVEELKKSFDK